MCSVSIQVSSGGVQDVIYYNSLAGLRNGNLAIACEDNTVLVYTNITTTPARLGTYTGHTTPVGFVTFGGCMGPSCVYDYDVVFSADEEEMHIWYSDDPTGENSFITTLPPFGYYAGTGQPYSYDGPISHLSRLAPNFLATAGGVTGLSSTAREVTIWGTFSATCKVPTPGTNYVSALCSSNMQLMKTTSAVLACSAPLTTEYVEEICLSGNTWVLGADTVRKSCSSPAPNQFTIAGCVTGSTTTYGSNTVIGNCAAPPVGSYVTSICIPGEYQIIGNDTVTAKCRLPVLGEFSSSACSPGNYFTKGNDTIVESCVTPSSGSSYTKTACTQGSYSIVGSNSVVLACSAPSASQYVKSICMAGNFGSPGLDTGIEECAVNNGTSYIKEACVPGSTKQTGSDTVIKDCTAPKAGVNFVVQKCTNNTDTVLATCAQPTNGQYASTACTPGNVYSIGSNTVIKVCKSPKEGDFTQAACVRGSAAKAGSDTVVLPCAAPIPSQQFVEALCVRGDFDVVGSNTDIAQCTTNSADSFIEIECAEGAAAGPVGANAIVTACTAPITEISYVKSPCTQSSDTQLLPCPVPDENTVLSKACISGNILVPGSPSELIRKFLYIFCLLFYPLCMALSTNCCKS